MKKKLLIMKRNMDDMEVKRKEELEVLVSAFCESVAFGNNKISSKWSMIIIYICMYVCVLSLWILGYLDIWISVYIYRVWLIGIKYESIMKLTDKDIYGINWGTVPVPVVCKKIEAVYYLMKAIIFIKAEECYTHI